MKKFYDTCSLLTILEKAFDETFVLSAKTLEEIESIKVSKNKDDSIKFKARQLVKLLDKNYGKYEVILENQEIYNLLTEKNLEQSPDNIIMATCFLYNQKEPIEFYSEDICAKVISREIFGLEVHSVREIDKTLTDEYLGYRYHTFEKEEDIAYFYEHLTENNIGILVNEYVILRDNENTILDKLKWNGERFVPLAYKTIDNDFTGKIKPRNLEQELAFDMLQDNKSTIKVLAGNYGTGKDFLMVSTALQLMKNNKYDKIMWVRNNIEVKNSKPIGFLPAGIKDKLLPFAMVMADHVGGESGLQMLLEDGKVEIQHLGFIRGRDIKNTIIMCSESENMTKEHIQLLIGRVGEGSTLWLNGDYRQVDDRVFETNNGLTTTIEKLKGNGKFGFVKLLKTERSETSAMADLLD